MLLNAFENNVHLDVCEFYKTCMCNHAIFVIFLFYHSAGKKMSHEKLKLWWAGKVAQIRFSGGKFSIRRHSRREH